jgi:hypothetical protein
VAKKSPRGEKEREVTGLAKLNQSTMRAEGMSKTQTVASAEDVMSQWPSEEKH